MAAGASEASSPRGWHRFRAVAEAKNSAAAANRPCEPLATLATMCGPKTGTAIGGGTAARIDFGGASTRLMAPAYALKAANRRDRRSARRWRWPPRCELMRLTMRSPRPPITTATSAGPRLARCGASCWPTMPTIRGPAPRDSTTARRCASSTVRPRRSKFSPSCSSASPITALHGWHYSAAQRRPTWPATQRPRRAISNRFAAATQKTI